MILEIDTTNRENIFLALMDKNQEKKFNFETQDQAKDLLLRINTILKKEKIALKNLTAILVNLGPGSFTGVRVGVTVANTLAWSLNLPVYGYKDKDRKKILAKIKNQSKSRFLKIVLPYYP